MPIRVENRHTYSGRGIYIGRGSAFGNPFATQPGKGVVEVVATRDEAVDKFATHLREKWATDPFFRQHLISLVKKYLRGEDIILVCSCKPKRCHGDVLVELVENMAAIGAVVLEPHERLDWFEPVDDPEGTPIVDEEGSLPF